MELDEFVRKTLESIVRGVSEARNSENGVGIAPDLYSANTAGQHSYIAAEERIAFPVNFDVALTVSSSSSKGGEAKISVLPMGLGGRLAAKSDETVIQKVSFVVPVMFPRVEAVQQNQYPKPKNDWVV
jgi:hypothetical protein